ncbi:MAG: glycosyltransferase family 2 protein [Myxococcota bacterium]|nr:glycosyltransferase family 2 protein [Myxococcota bacterium]
MTIIARDEADRIGDAIRSVDFADEVLVLDSGSADDTVAVARALGARVERTDWPGHVAQKNRALALASHDWILSIDADERVGPELAAAVRTVMADGPRAAGYAVSRLSTDLGAELRHGNWYPDRRVRLFDRRCARWGGRDPHDRVVLDGRRGDLSGDLLHVPYRNFGEHLRTIDQYAATSAAGLRADGVEARWWDLLLRPPLHFVKGYLLRAGFRDGTRGLLVAVLGAVYVLLKWSRVRLGEEGP